MMKKILFLVLILSHSLFAQTIVVSDLDDTIKITNSGDEVDGIRNALFTNKVFTGIPDFLRELSYSTDELNILSASPTILKRKIEKNLEVHKIDFRELQLRNIIRSPVKLDYKVNYLLETIKRSPNAKLILIGDDIGQDPEVFDEIKRHYPDMVLASYVHVIKNRAIPSGLTKYWLTTDLLVREYAAGRISKTAVENGFDLILNETEMENVIPDFANCPISPFPWAWQLATSFISDAHKVVTKINEYCINRSFDKSI